MNRAERRRFHLTVSYIAVYVAPFPAERMLSA